MQPYGRVFLVAGRANLLRNVDAIFSAAYGGTIKKVPEEFVCPITMELFHYPVVAADGFTYEMRAIARHLQSKHPRSPKTNLTLTNKMLVPNANLRTLMRDIIHRGRTILDAKASKCEQAVLAEPERKRKRRQ